MHAFLYTDPKLLPSQITRSQYTLIIQPEDSIGIEEIRSAQNFLSRLPPKNQKNYLVVYEAEKMTVPAQNAFLKTLEEPPIQSIIYLVTSFPSSLLPTILSRVYIINSDKPLLYTSDTLEISRILWGKLQKSGVGECFAVIDSENFDRNNFLHFLDDLEFIMHENLDSLNPIHYSLISEARIYTQSNCNLRLVIDNFLAQIVIQ